MISGPLVSVIVPIYNMEPYLARCVDSIRGQTEKNLEIILVDDGSRDGCPQMCDEYARRDSRVRVIHQKNQGVSAARNAGMRAAEGAWIAFCDPDDWMDATELEILLAAAEKENADIAICGCYFIDRRGQVLEKQGQEISPIYRFEQAEIRDLIYDIVAPGYLINLKRQGIRQVMVPGAPWGRIYRAERIEGLEFPRNIHPKEDDVFNLYAFGEARKVIFLTQRLHYYQQGTGVLSRFRRNAVENAEAAKRLITDFLVDKYLADFPEVILRELEADYLFSYFGGHFFHEDNPSSYRARKEGLKRYMEENVHFWGGREIIPYLSLKERIKYILIFNLRWFWPFELLRMLRKCRAHFRRERIG